MDRNKDESLRANPSPCDTFWTICNHCKVHYEHLKKYHNCTLLCNNCKTPFMALATSPPQKFPKSSSQVPKQRQQSSSSHVRSQTQRRNMSSDPSVGATTVHMDHGAFAESISKEESVKKRKLEDYSTYSQPNITRKLTALETRKMLIENTRKMILMKLSAWGSTTDEARGNVGGTNKNEHPEQSHPQQIRNQIKVMRGNEDHKPNRSDERKIIENAGGVVMWAGKLGGSEGVLAMSRAFGNQMLKQFVVAEPEIQDAVSIAQTEEEPQAAARKLTETAFTRGSYDNITCIVVKFHHEKVGPEEPEPVTKETRENTKADPQESLKNPITKPEESEKDSGAEPVESQECR